MAWPIHSDYSEAVQNPNQAFQDRDLSASSPELTKLGLPWPRTGNFAIVFHMVSPAGEWAARCFLRSQENRELRYKTISQHLAKTNLPWFVEFEYLSDAMMVKGETYPILKMEWLKGIQLDDYVLAAKQTPDKITDTASAFVAMTESLHDNNVAHGDLQHGNVMLVNGNLRLVDYDGLYVPGLDRHPPDELGHRNYQLPSRGENDYGPGIDGFSAWTIYTSLISLAKESSLCHSLGALDGEHLVFRKTDFESPDESNVFVGLSKSNNAEVRSLAAHLAELAFYDSTDIPHLSKETIKSALSSVTTIATGWVGQALRSASVNDAIDQALSALGADSSWVASHLPRPELKPFGINFVAERMLLTVFVFFSLVLGMLFVFDTASFATTEESFIDGAFANYLLIMGGATFIGALVQTAVLGILLDFRYRRLGVVRERAEKRSQRRAAVKRLSEVRKRIELIVADARGSIAQIDFDAMNMEEAREAAKASRDKQISEARAESENMEKKLRLRLSRLDKDRNSALASESANYQANSIRNYMRQASIQRASILGIGPVLAGRLEARGIKSAADISSIEIGVQYYGRHSNEVARIVTAKGLRIRVEGIGPKKAKALRRWHQSIGKKAMRQVTASLPQSVRQSIESRYQNEERQTRSELAQIGPKTNAKLDAIRDKYGRFRKGSEKKKKLLSRRERAATSQLHKDLEPERVALKQANSQLVRSNLELSSYRRITFLRYILAALFVGKLLQILRLQ